MADDAARVSTTWLRSQGSSALMAAADELDALRARVNELERLLPSNRFPPMCTEFEVHRDNYWGWWHAKVHLLIPGQGLTRTGLELVYEGNHKELPASTSEEWAVWLAQHYVLPTPSAP